MDDKRFFESLEGLAHNLDRLASVANAQLEQSTLITSVLRGKLNGLLLSGMVQLQGVAGAWSYEDDFTVDYAAVGYIDSLGFGPYTIAVDAMGASSGPGTFQTGVTLAGTIPLIGKHLSITSNNAGSTPPSLFVAVFTDAQDLLAQ